MFRTRVGYAGGSTEAPTYTNIGDHTETIQVDYDPTQITYRDLLAVFWDSHNPTLPAYSRQYASIVHYTDEEQRQAALASRAAEAERLGEEILTEILPLMSFTRAEGYHQKYRLRGNELLSGEVAAYYPDDIGFTDSTTAMRLNAYLGGYGSRGLLEDEIEGYGLSAEGAEALRALVGDKLPDDDPPIPNCGG